MMVIMLQLKIITIGSIEIVFSIVSTLNSIANHISFCFHFFNSLPSTNGSEKLKDIVYFQDMPADTPTIQTIGHLETASDSKCNQIKGKTKFIFNESDEKNSGVWSCIQCFTMFYASFIKQWSSKSVTTEEQLNQISSEIKEKGIFSATYGSLSSFHSSGQGGTKDLILDLTFASLLQPIPTFSTVPTNVYNQHSIQKIINNQCNLTKLSKNELYQQIKSNQDYQIMVNFKSTIELIGIFKIGNGAYGLRFRNPLKTCGIVYLSYCYPKPTNISQKKQVHYHVFSVFGN
ncbi:hypothetical protein ACTFIU_006918 [Dictyostelium citrinum]